jgi:hypothetical protein
LAQPITRNDFGYFAKPTVLAALIAYAIVSVVLAFFFPHIAQEIVMTYVGAIFVLMIGEAIQRVQRKKDPELVKDQLISYYKQKSEALLKENWPYDIDEETFVRNFSFKYGGILSLTRQLEEMENCLDFIEKTNFTIPVLCVGYYGMGKTTISKILFRKLGVNTRRFPVYLSLSHRPLKPFLNEGLGVQIADEVVSFENRNGSKLNRTSLALEIDKLIRDGRILLVFDGIDEAICDSEEDLIQFIRFIFGRKFPTLLTCRMEYSPFFDACQTVNLKDDSATCIELCEWSDAQWKSYVNGLTSKYRSKGEAITTFYNKIKNGTYATLPGRPLFLKMLSDLEVNNKTGIVIERDLSSNLAEIYYKFLKWKIQDDYDRKGGTHKNLDRTLFENECFRLLIKIAVLEYTSQQGSVALDEIRRTCAHEHFIHLTEEYVTQTLLRSTLFAILRRTTVDSFSFSHRSFMEYLVAYKLAECILPLDKSQYGPHCDDTWKVFQTHEVSSHFLCEVERVAVTNKLGEQTDESISSAFKEVVISERTSPMYSERFQEVLYYIGKLKLESKELRDLLLSIIKNKSQYDPIYYRAANIALSRILGNQYCENYVLELLRDPLAFETNKVIQLRYYGKTSIRSVLKKDIDEYISGRNESSIISLKILTYFTALTPSKDELPALLTYLQQIRSSASRLADRNIQLICEDISTSLVTTAAALA